MRDAHAQHQQRHTDTALPAPLSRGEPPPAPPAPYTHSPHPLRTRRALPGATVTGTMGGAARARQGSGILQGEAAWRQGSWPWLVAELAPPHARPLGCDARCMARLPRLPPLQCIDQFVCTSGVTMATAKAPSASAALGMPWAVGEAGRPVLRTSSNGRTHGRSASARAAPMTARHAHCTA